MGRFKAKKAPSSDALYGEAAYVYFQANRLLRKARKSVVMFLAKINSTAN